MGNGPGDAPALTQMLVDWLWVPLWAPTGTAAGMAVAVVLVAAALFRRTYAVAVLCLGLVSWLVVLASICLRIEGGFGTYIAFVLGCMLPAPGLTGLLFHSAKAAITAAVSRSAVRGAARAEGHPDWPLPAQQAPRIEAGDLCIPGHQAR
ncbi:MAG: hypothetical protein ACE15C_00685 [Phycisphaerae bacterium]